MDSVACFLVDRVCRTGEAIPSPRSLEMNRGAVLERASSVSVFDGEALLSYSVVSAEKNRLRPEALEKTKTSELGPSARNKRDNGAQGSRDHAAPQKASGPAVGHCFNWSQPLFPGSSGGGASGRSWLTNHPQTPTKLD